MKARINEMYRTTISDDLMNHLVAEIGLCDDDLKIFESLHKHSANSEWHYDNVSMPKEVFERRLKRLNNILFYELIRLAEIGIKTTLKQN